ncbi:MAG TPA: LamG domain-containing protein [Planctomycetaceae bacterium]|nr:LamG domain-containing protein [Planctomycetaceae bacterium]
MYCQLFRVAMLIVLIIASSGTGCAQSNLAEPDGPSRQPVPNPAVLMQAVNSLKSLYATDYSRAAKAGGSKLVLAKKLLETAAETRNEPISKYAALTEAKRLSLEVGDVATAFQSVELMTTEYELSALTEKTSIIEQLGSAGSTVSTLRELAKKLPSALEETASAEDFRSAKKIHSVAVEAARRLGDNAFSNRLDRAKTDLEGIELQFAEYTEAKKSLARDPRDKSANRIVGLYLGLRRDNWEEGEKHILLAQDDVLHPLFVRQCSPPGDASEQGALADAWWDWALLQKGISKSQARELAVSWYRLCQVGLAGLARTRADDRLKSSNGLLAVRLVAAAQSAAIGRATNGSDDVLLKKGLIAHYPLRGHTRDESGRNNHAKARGARPAPGILDEPDGAYQFDGQKSAIVATSQAYLNLSNPNDFTISFWAKRAGKCDFSFIVCKNRGNRPGTATKWTVVLGTYLHPHPTLAFHWDGLVWVRSNPIPWDTEWHSYTITRSGPEFSLYLDGERIGTQQDARPISMNNPGDLTIGSSVYEGEASFNGSVSDVRIYSRALSDAEVASLHLHVSDARND